MEKRKTRDKRKVLLALPLLILPFAALAFYAMGGGKGEAKVMIRSAGINTTLPDATFSKEKPRDKMGIYNMGNPDLDSAEGTRLDQIADRLGFNADPRKDPTAEIDLKLKQLNAQINAPVEPVSVSGYKDRSIKVPGMSSDVDRLEQLMSAMQHPASEDPEMKQLSGMLEKVLDIQHPERVRDAYVKNVSAAPQEKFAAIPAQIAAKQTLVQGAVLKLVLTDSVSVSGIRFSKGQEIFGLCNLANQRLLVDIKTIRLGNNIIPVDLSVYSLDGIKGIAAPDAIVDNAVSGGADDAVRSLQVLTMDQSIGTQVAGAGIDAAKGLFSKKVRRIKIKVKAGFAVLLRDNQIKN